jgi:hypothetical protein
MTSVVPQQQWKKGFNPCVSEEQDYGNQSASFHKE